MLKPIARGMSSTASPLVISRATARSSRSLSVSYASARFPDQRTKRAVRIETATTRHGPRSRPALDPGSDGSGRITSSRARSEGTLGS